MTKNLKIAKPVPGLDLPAVSVFPAYFNLYISLPANRKAPDPYS
jgi:hypothetical protein